MCRQRGHGRELVEVAVQATIEAWRRDYNEIHPRSSLGDLTSAESIQLRPGQRERQIAPRQPLTSRTLVPEAYNL